MYAHHVFPDIFGGHHPPQLASFHILRLLEAGELPEAFELKYETFTYQIFCAAWHVCNGRDPPSTAIGVSAALYATLRPAALRLPPYEPWMSGLMEEAARMAATNMSTHMLNLAPFARRWLKMKIAARDSVVSMPSKSSSALSALWTAIESERPVQEVVDRYGRLKDGQLPAADVAFLQTLADEMRPRLPDPEKHGAVLIFLHSLLPDLRERADEIRVEMEIKSLFDAMFDAMGCDTPKKRRKVGRQRAGRLVFPLLPQAKVRAKYVRLTNTSLKELVAALARPPRSRNALDYGGHSYLAFASMVEADEAVRGAKEQKKVLLEAIEAAGADADTAELKNALDSVCTAIAKHTVDMNAMRWRRCFDLGRVMSKKKMAEGTKAFAGSIMTDGLGVSVLCDRAKNTEELASMAVGKSVAASKREHAVAVAAAKKENRAPPRRIKTTGEVEQADAIAAAKVGKMEKARDLLGFHVGADGTWKIGCNARAPCGLDPGKKCPYTCAVWTAEADGALRHRCEGGNVGTPSASNVRFPTVRMTKSENYWRNGYNRRVALTRKWVASSPAVKAFNEGAPSAAVATLEEYKARCEAVCSALPDLSAFYVGRRRVRRLRFGTYMRGQAAAEYMCADVCGTSDPKEQKRTVVAFGDASIGRNMRGTAPMTSKGFLRKLQERCCVLMTTEFRSSMCCCCCWEPMRGEEVVGDDGRSSRLWGVRRCSNTACERTLWDRDVNAAINILFFMLWELRGEELPDVFRRGVSGAAVVELTEPEVDEEVPGSGDEGKLD